MINYSRVKLLSIARTTCSTFPANTNIDGYAAAKAIATTQAISENDAESVLNAITAYICPRGVIYRKTPPKPTPTRKPKPQKITLKVFGNGSESNVITYAVDTSIEQATNARLPWRKKVDPYGTFYQVSGQDEDGTSITCEILDTDGTVLDKETSTGQYAIASCSSSY